MEINRTIRRKTEKKVIQMEEFSMKESRRCNVLVLIDHRHDLKMMLSSVIRLCKYYLSINKSIHLFYKFYLSIHK